MTAAFLQSELTNLISDSKRKHAEIRSAAEKSLNELKSISVTSETQLAGDLIRKSQFIDPFILACKSQNTKLASNGTACLQRLVASTAVPHARLLDLLQAYEEAAPLSLEVQLKILQTLPSLLQLYTSDLHGEALSRTLSISADLSSNKLPMVSGTASATFQQLLTTVFTKAAATSSQRSEIDRGDQPNRDCEDAIAVLGDLGALLKGGQSKFVRLEKLSPSLILETVENLLSTYGAFVLAEKAALRVCAEYLTPGISNLIESSASYPVVVRAYRIAFILTTQYLLQITDSIASLLKIILKATDRGGTHKWKRILSLEFCRGFCSDFDALRRSFRVFDMTTTRFSFVSDLMASLVRIASEDPTLIGLGRQSTIPTTTAADNNGDLARAVETPITVGSIAQADTSSVGISAQGSSIQTPCLDQYDKAVPAEFPDTYIFALVLGCISAFSDGVSKFIMPLSVPNRRANTITSEDQDDIDNTQSERKSSLRNAPSSQKYQQLTNPLTRKDLGRLGSVEECAKMIESCWPAVLATCSTFLNAALDSYFYHMLIRTVQKLTQVSGVLELNTPRDALLTTLAKVSVPANVSSLMNAFYGHKPAYQSDTDALYNGDETVMKSSISTTPRQSVDLSSQHLNVRNLLCLRALLNLGIALGPTMSTSAWMIVWQSLEQVEALMSVNPTTKLAQTSGNPATSDGSSSSTLASEITAVDTARRRMIESTTAYSDAAFHIVCKSLFHMIEEVIPDGVTPAENTPSHTLDTLRPTTLAHKSTRSVSGSWAKVTTLEIEVQFVLKFIGRLASVNLHRFKDDESSNVSWYSIVSTLSLLQRNPKLQPYLRLQCANIIDAVVVESCSTSSEEEEVAETDNTEVVEKFSIPALHRQIENVQYHASSPQKSTDVETQTVLLMLEALHNVVGTCGEDLDRGWKEVFATLNSVISHRVLDLNNSVSDASPSQHEVISKIYSAAFKVTHLIAADFLLNLQDDSLGSLLRLFGIFGSQKTDLNMSLTTIALYWNLSGLINDRADHLEPFEKVAETMNSGSDNKYSSNLWQATILGLQHHCQDNRSDSRNAAVRMLAKITETSIPKMSSATLNSYYVMVSLPLLDFYSQGNVSSEGSWGDTALQVLQELVITSQNYGDLLMQDVSFRETWTRLIASSGKLLRTEDINTATRIYDALSDVVIALCRSDTSTALASDRVLLETSWNLWRSRDPTKFECDDQNQNSFASYARFLLAMADWNLKELSAFDGASSHIAEVTNRLIYRALHESYTVDINKVSVEQEQVLRVLDVLKELLLDDPRTYILHLLSFPRGLVQRLEDINRDGQPTKLARGVRQPTGVAFAASCVEKLRLTIRSQAASTKFLDGCPFTAILDTCIDLIKTKYGSVPVNNKEPLWQKATLLATECTATFQSHQKQHLQQLKVDDLVSTTNKVLAAILAVTHLETKAPESRPSAETILADETFDITQANALHTAVHSILLKSTNVSQSVQKQYILTLFHYSLVAQPWYNDLPSNLDEKPLETLAKIRPGSIRAPKLSIRQNIYPEALKCLFSLVAESSDAPADNTNTNEIVALSSIVAPYILLRLAHTLKTFLADQPLRYLQHPHSALQHELHVVLRAFLDLHVSDSAFTSTVCELGLNSNTIQHDGKTHLRIMAGLATKFEKLWWELPRLPNGLAWQDCEDGLGVQKCLREWREALTQETTVVFK